MIFEDIKKLAKENENFRKVIFTGSHSQLVLMSIPVGGEIGMETHQGSDQILFFVDGSAEADVNGEVKNIAEHAVVFVPAGTAHNIKNTGNESLKLYTTYAPSVHPDGVVEKTREEAMQKEKV